MLIVMYGALILIALGSAAWAGHRSGLVTRLKSWWFHRELKLIQSQRELVFKFQHILKLPDAEDRLLIEGILGGWHKVEHRRSPTMQQVKEFIRRNRHGYTKTGGEGISEHELSVALERLQKHENEALDALHVLAMRGKPVIRELFLIEQRARVQGLEHVLEAERSALEKLEALSASTDPYGRSPKTRVDLPAESEEAHDDTGAHKKKAKF